MQVCIECVGGTPTDDDTMKILSDCCQTADCPKDRADSVKLSAGVLEVVPSTVTHCSLPGTDFLVFELFKHQLPLGACGATSCWDYLIILDRFAPDSLSGELPLLGLPWMAHSPCASVRAVCAASSEVFLVSGHSPPDWRVVWEGNWEAAG